MVESVLNNYESLQNNREVPKQSSAEIKNKINELDKPLNIEQVNDIDNKKRSDTSLDKPLNSSNSPDVGNDVSRKDETKEIKKIEPPIVIEFKCSPPADCKEFARQLKGQERGINSQTVAENSDNRASFEQRKAETGNGRDLSEGKKAQEIAREKALYSRIESNQKNGMSYSEAKSEAEQWISTQDALHNPDQIAGGNPAKVSRMGDRSVNRSIGKQWAENVKKLADGVNDYSSGKSREELENTKMNVKLVIVYGGVSNA